MTIKALLPTYTGLSVAGPVGTTDNYELFDFSKMKIVSQENKSVDEDEMFLLSLVSEMNKVPAEKKTDTLRGDIIFSIAAAQVQVLPQSQPHWPPEPNYAHPPQQRQFNPYSASHTNSTPSVVSTHNTPQSSA